MEGSLAMLGLGAVSYLSSGAYSPGAPSQCPSAGESFDAFDLRCASVASLQNPPSPLQSNRTAKTLLQGARLPER